MDGHSVKITHGYGGNAKIILDSFELKNIASYAVKGEPGKSPEVTVTLLATSVVYETSEKI